MRKKKRQKLGLSTSWKINLIKVIKRKKQNYEKIVVIP